MAEGQTAPKVTSLATAQPSETVRALELYGKVANGTPLAKRRFVNNDAITEAGNLAVQCGKLCTAIEELRQFVEPLDGYISVENTQHRYHLVNTLIEGFATNLAREQDAIVCAKLLKPDSTWIHSAEKALILAAAPLLRNGKTYGDFIYLLSERGAIFFAGFAMSRALEK
jgi:hypothetical protein